MKNLLMCPSCEADGRRNILGELDNQGHLLVLRFHKGVTRIIGDSYTVVCDLCSEPIYIKKGGNFGTVLSYGFERVFGLSSSIQTGSIGTYGTAG